MSSSEDPKSFMYNSLSNISKYTKLYSTHCSIITLDIFWL